MELLQALNMNQQKQHRTIIQQILHKTALLLFLASFAAFAQDIGFTPEQLAQLESLTPAQRQTLLNSLGSGTVSQSQAITQTPIVEPVEVPPRETNNSNQDGIQENAQNRIGQQTLRRDAELQDIAAQGVELQESEAPLEQYGYNLFAGSPTTFAPATDIPVPANYIMGPGDTVILQLYGQQNLSYELVVSREGMLLFPEIGPISVSGLNFDELRAQINDIVASQLIGQRVAVTLGSLRSIRIFILGEAFRPGSYTVSALSTMTNALFVSGGITNVGSLRHIQLRRQGETVSELDLYDLLLRGDTSADVRLLPDDVLFVPPIGNTVGVAGEVIRPAIYELKDESTVDEVVALSGGTLATAFISASRIERIDAEGNRTLIDTDLRTDNDRQLEVVNGDVIQIYSVLDRLDNIVITEGHLHRPGGFQWREGLRVSDVIPTLDMLLPNPDTSYALIVREVPPTSELEVHRVQLAAALASPGSVADLLLQPRDRLITFAANGERQQALASLLDELSAQARFERPASVVSVQGNVRFPGSYPLLQGMTVGDLLDSAAGLLEDTDMNFSLLIRRRDSRGTIEALNAIDSSGRSIDFDRIVQADDALYVFNAAEPRADLLAPVNVQLRAQADSLERASVVAATGQVRFPGEYPLFDNMTVEELVNASGGYTESALTTEAEMTRYYIYEDSGREVRHLNIDLTDSSSLGKQFRLVEFDTLVVKQLPNWVAMESIELSGEVVSPGTYSISKGDSLSSVLMRAGGLTSFADPNASILLRAELRERERELLQEYQRQLESDLAAVALEEEGAEQAEATQIAEGLLEQVAELEPLGRLVINLPSLLAGEASKDVIIRNGDQLFIPRTRQEVSIMGEVNRPTSHLFDAELSVGDYINLSGGLTQRSDEGRIYIIKADGQVVSYDNSRWFFERDEQSLERGDTIVVPFDIEPTNYLAVWTSVSTVLFNLATTVLAIENVSD